MASPLSNPNYTLAKSSIGFMSHPLPMIQIDGKHLTFSQDFQLNYPMWVTLRDLYNGEAAVKAKSEVYLRRLSSHGSNDYSAYLARTPYYNAIKRTHMGLMGSIFRKPPEYTLPTQLSKEINFDSVTNEALSMNEFMSLTVSEILITGRFGTLVDLPDSTQDSFPNPDNEKPYFATYTAENILGARTKLINNRLVVDRIYLREFYTTYDDLTSTTKEQIRILRLDPDPDADNPRTTLRYSQTIIRIENGIEYRSEVTPRVKGRTLDYIPFVFFNTKDLSHKITAPPLQDIACLNIMHYEASALLAHALFYAGMPTYYICGEGNNNPLSEFDTEAQKMSVGPSSLWWLGKDDKPGILEFNGHGLTFLENSVQDKQAQMQSMGGRLISTQRKQAALSSEAYTLMEMSDESTLLDVTIQAERGVRLLLTYWADLANITLPTPKTSLPSDQVIKVELNKEFVRSDLTAREVRALQSLYERGIIPLDVLYYTLRQVGVIPMEYTLEEFKALLNTSGQVYKDPALEQQAKLKNKELDLEDKQHEEQLAAAARIAEQQAETQRKAAEAAARTNNDQTPPNPKQPSPRPTP